MNTEDKIVLAYLNPEKQYELKAFLQTVLFFFENNPALSLFRITALHVCSDTSVFL